MVSTDVPSTDIARVTPATHHAEPRTTRLLFPILIGALAVGVVLFVVANRQAEVSAASGHFAVFWLGMLAGIAAIAWAGFRARRRSEFNLALTLFGVFTFVPKFVESVNSPAYFDEYAHLRHVQDMLASGHVGVTNPFLPVVRFYPGLGLATEAVHFVTRLSLWHSGQVIILAAHCAAILLVSAVAVALGLSRRAAFFAALIFATNPSFLYFDSQYAYESLAIPLMLATVYCTVRVRRAPTARSGYLFTGIGILSAVATALTHHISALVGLTICLLVAIFVPAAGYADPDAPARSRRLRPLIEGWVLAVWTAAASGLWVLGFASSTRAYLFPSLRRGYRQVLQRITGHSVRTVQNPLTGTTDTRTTAHTPFAGTSIPLYERAVAVILPFLVLALIAYNVWRIWRTPNRRRELRLAAPFLVLSAGYFLSLPLALTAGGGDPAHRSWPFLYIGVAIVAVWSFGRPSIQQSRRLQLSGPRRIVVVAVGLLVLTIGNVASGANVIYRFPGPPVFATDGRFETAELSQLTTWVDGSLPGGAGVVTDRFTAQAVMARTRLNVPTSSQAFAYALYSSPKTPSDQLRAFLRANNFHYFILDERITTQIPTHSFFQAYRGYRLSIAPHLLSTITDSPFIRLIHSTQNYRVYQINP
jgi:hypothetical protein